MSHRFVSLFSCGLCSFALLSCNSTERREVPASAGQHGPEETEEYCRSVKPGVITSVNSMCAVMVEDPVDPALTPTVWKGQKVGFCCQGCIPRWEQMTDAQRDSNLAKAIANSVPAVSTTTDPARW